MAETWHLVRRKENVRAVKNRWVFTKKFDNQGQVKRYKARLVAKGYTQKYGVDYNETFSPVAKFKSIRVLAALCALLKLSAFQDDVPSAFLKGSLKETIYMEQPEGFGSDKSLVCLLKKTLYGLKQSPREWNFVLHQYMLSKGFVQSQADTCIYVNSKNQMFVGIYVDDIVTVGHRELVGSFREDLRSEFKITEGGPLEWYLGVAFHLRDDGSITLDQNVYVHQKLEEFKEYVGATRRSSPLPSNYQQILQEAKNEPDSDGKFPYRRIVGSLMYAMLATRPDLACSISVVSQFLEKPKPSHIGLVKHILQYLAQNTDVKLVYQSTGKVELVGYADASYANEEGYKSRTGYGFLVGPCLVSWYSKKQSVVAQSAAEAEYYSAVAAANEAIWIKQLIEDLGFKQGTITLFEDNQACIALTKNPEDHKRTKHIQVKYHVIRDYVSKNLIKFVYCSTQNQLADMFTKGISGSALRRMLLQFGLQIQKSGGE
jgi:hypothetical protein